LPEDATMTMNTTYAASEPTRADVDALPGPALVEFGAPWCGHCQAAQPALAAALADQPGFRHLKIEDGRGRRLGRSYGIKLWPTLVVLRDGREVARVVRPTAQREIADALAQAAG
jgi:thioredoxin 1